MFKSSSKAIVPIIATSLLVAIGILATLILTHWNTSYLSSVQTSNEQSSTSLSSSSVIQNYYAGSLYLKNINSYDLQVQSIKVSSLNCNLSPLLHPGLNVIDISSCIGNSTSTSPIADITILYNNSILETKNFYIGSLSASSCTDPNLIPSNIKFGVTLLGVTGTYSGSSTTIVDNDGDGYVNVSSTDSTVFSFINSTYGYGADCNDSNASIHAALDGTCDGDGDGYIDASAGGPDYFDNDPTQTGYPISCKQLYDIGFTTNGVYTIDPDGANSTFSPFSVYCDLSGGGWTLFARQISTIANSNIEVNTAYGTLVNATQTTDAKLSDAQINAIANYSSNPIYKEDCEGRINYYQIGQAFDATNPQLGNINISITSADSGYFAVSQTYGSCSKGLQGCDYSAPSGWGANAGNSPAALYSGESGFGLTNGCSYSDSVSTASSSAWFEGSGTAWVR